MKRKRDEDFHGLPPNKHPRLSTPSFDSKFELSKDKPNNSNSYFSVEHEGDIFYLEYEEEDYSSNIPRYRSENLLGEDINSLLERVRKRNFSRKNDDVLNKLKSKKKKERRESFNFSQLLVDKYRPDTYCELLTDEGINTRVLGWVKKWDKVVFPSKSRKRKDLPKDGPFKKFLLMSGAPGIGKTTLAHIVAKTAGYEAVEINASDDRSEKRLVNLINNVSMKKNVFFHKSTMEREKPKLLILDEVDGAVGGSEFSAIRALVEASKQKAKPKSKKKNKKKKKIKKLKIGGKSKKIRKVVSNQKRVKIEKLRIPTILICNNPFQSFLRELRNCSEFVHFSKPGYNVKVMNRLVDICRLEKIEISRPLLKTIVESFGNDIRSCLNYLQFYLINKFYFGDDIEKNDLERAIKDVKKFKKDVLDIIFTSRVRGESFADVFYKLASEMGNTQILDSCFQNFPRMRYTDFQLEKTNQISDFLSFNDNIELVIRKNMNFQLSYFMIVTLVCINFNCQSPFKEFILLKSEDYERRQNSQSIKQIIENFKTKMNPKLFENYGSSRNNLILDLFPVIRSLLNPSGIRKNVHNIQILTTPEKQEVMRLIHLHNNFGTTYFQKTNSFSKRKYFQIVPNIFDLSYTFRKYFENFENKNKPYVRFEIPFGVQNFISQHTGNKRSKGQEIEDMLLDSEERKEKKREKIKKRLSVNVEQMHEKYKKYGMSTMGMSPMSPIENQFNFHESQPPTKRYCRFIFQGGSTKAVRTKASKDEF